jgi:hypothetical protein
MIQTQPIISEPESSEVESVNYHHLPYCPIDRILQRISKLEIPGKEKAGYVTYSMVYSASQTAQLSRRK